MLIHMEGWALGRIKCTTERKGNVKKLTGNETNIRMKNQLAYWQNTKTFSYAFPNGKDERDFNFSGISYQNLMA